MDMSTTKYPELKVFRTIWGAESQYSSDIDILFKELHRLGFDGVEASLNDIHRLSNNNDQLFIQTLKENQLDLIGICYTNWPDFAPGTWQDLSVETHLKVFEQQFEELVRFNPIHINIHGGQDDWTIEEHEQFFQGALTIQDKYSQVSSSHETHRGRSLFNPSLTLHLLRRFPLLRLTADFSHWLLVCERLLNHPSDHQRFKEILPRVDHIHARVGTVQHAQTNDPIIDTPIETEFLQQLWKTIWDEQLKSGKSRITLTPEYGTFPYAMNQDIDVWSLTNREMERQKNNYKQWIDQYLFSNSNKT